MYDYDYTPPIKRHAVWMIWFVLISALVVGGIYLIGKAANDDNKADFQRQIECLNAGGEMERISGIGGIYCNKDD